MSAVMDELLGSDIGVPLGSLGSACAQVADAMAQGAEQSFLAGVFWWLFTKSSAYLDTASRLGAGTYARPVVVRHAEGTRYDLLLLDPQRGDDNWAAVQLDPFQTSFGMAFPDVSEERLSSVLRRAELADVVAPATLFETARELAASSQFGVAVVTAPEEIPTCAVWPAVGVHAGNEDEPVATLGAYFGDQDVLATDTCIATTVDHALANGWQGFTVDGAPLEHHRSALRKRQLRATGEEDAPGRAAAQRAPGAVADGPNSAPASEFLRSEVRLTEVHFLNWDPSIVDPSADKVVRVYTEADTRVGDSGAALIDENDFIVGFAPGELVPRP